MTFSVGEAFNNFAERLSGFPIIGTMLKNPIYTAILITLIICLIAMAIFEDEEMNTKLLKFAVYGVVAITTVLCVNHAIMRAESSAASMRTGAADLVRTQITDPFYGSLEEIKPDIDFTTL
ncbi:hypothetical protein F-S17_0157 [Faustovirus]|nr:hypothetical protein F-LCD7_0172 [Faustovirus]QJX72423.1 hypothetical protein F-S17_0157 [Faustovirus]QJX72933.1 hypothetical protein F-VV57_0171 [Faustovirus]QJX73438.1 hypothetical protein F-VV63_0172 [Faustovirus]QJX73949.1 hypothetical protein F-E9_176 [Faustovirus]